MRHISLGRRGDLLKNNDNGEYIKELWKKNSKYSKYYRISNTNSNNMRGRNHIVIEDNNKGFNIKWILNIIQTTHKRKAKDGSTKEYQSYSTFFPKGLLDYIGDVNQIYLYEHFETVCISKEKPTQYTSILLKTHLNIGKNDKRYGLVEKYGDRTITLPKKYWDITKDKKVELTLHNKPDYANPQKFLITIDIVDS